MNRALVVLLVVLISAASAPPAHAMSCTITSMIGVAFGAYDVFSSSPVDSVGNIMYECTGVGPADTISIDLSTGSASGYFPRRMVQGADFLEYNLCLDPGYSSVWGNGMSGTDHYVQVSPPDGSPVTVSIHGRIPALQNVRAGSYADTIVATVVF